jgi:hypothetical protein
VKLGLAWLATCLAVVGCSTGGAARSAHAIPARPSLRFATTGLQSAGGGRVHLTDYTDSDSPTSGVILIGAIGDFGSGRLDQRTGHFDLQLSHGSVRLQFADLDAQFLAALRELSVNQTTCSAFAQVSGTAPIVAGAGTGSYAHLTGTFFLTVTLDEVFHPGACNELSPFAAQKIVTSGWGTIQNHIGDIRTHRRVYHPR